MQGLKLGLFTLGIATGLFLNSAVYSQESSSPLEEIIVTSSLLQWRCRQGNVT